MEKEVEKEKLGRKRGMKEIGRKREGKKGRERDEKKESNERDNEREGDREIGKRHTQREGRDTERGKDVCWYVFCLIRCNRFWLKKCLEQSFSTFFSSRHPVSLKKKLVAPLPD